MESINSSYAATLSGTAVIEAKVSGIPLPKIKWVKDNKELLIKDRIKVESKTEGDIIESRLVIQGTQANDAGAYKVEASNKCSLIVQQIDVTVKGTLRI